MLNRKPFFLLHIFILLALFTGSALPPAQATSDPVLVTPDTPSRPPADLQPPGQPLAEPLSTLALPPLKAVLLVGPIDGNSGPWTLEEVANMELAADVLEDNGVEVHRFYPGSGSFAEIEAAAEGAHFLLYRGHGVYDGSMPSPNVGGFSLSSGYYSPDRIRNYLHLAPNAIVMLYGCFTAGSSSAPGDEYDIGITEASRRVAQYSNPFFDVGAAGYYANWFDDAFEQFLSNLFAGQTLGDAYENYFDFNENTVYRTTHPDHPALAMWVDKDNWGYWKYNNAFAGQYDQTLADLFKTATLGGIPASLEFTVDVAESLIIQPSTFVITPTNLSSSTPIAWLLDVQGDWFSVSALQGQSPAASFSVTPAAFDTTQPGEYTGVITVTATAPQGTENPIQPIAVHMSVLAPELGGLPDRLVSYYSIPDQKLIPGQYSLMPQNTGNLVPLQFSLTTDSTWIGISPESGENPQTFEISASVPTTPTVGSCTGTITVTATMLSLAAVYQSPKIITYTLHVLDTSLYQNNLPLILKP